MSPIQDTQKIIGSLKNALSGSGNQQNLKTPKQTEGEGANPLAVQPAAQSAGDSLADAVEMIKALEDMGKVASGKNINFEA
jgi:hypothetical protein